MKRSCADASFARASERHRRSDARARAGHLGGPEPRTPVVQLRIDVRVACPVALHERRVCGGRPRPARPALRAGGPAPDGGGPPCRALAGSGSGLGAWPLWPAMQRRPTTNAAKDMAVLVRGSREWTDEDAVREQLERAVARFGGERLVVIAGGGRGADRRAEACARGLPPGRRGLPHGWRSPRPLGGVPTQRPDARPARRLPHRYVFAFSNGSRGTRHAIDQARRRGSPVLVAGREARLR
jgi:YspA, cpYpsA-related SLOG family